MSGYETARDYFQQREARRRAAREAEREQWLVKSRQVIRQLLPDHPGVRQVFLFGSLMQPGRFRPDSDIDVAVVCDSPAVESDFWRALERALRRNVDVRPLVGAIKETALREGEQIL